MPADACATAADWATWPLTSPDTSGRALVIAGARDPFGLGWQRRNLQLLAASRPDSLIVADAGHFAFAEQPQVVLPAIERSRHVDFGPVGVAAWACAIVARHSRLPRAQQLAQIADNLTVCR